MKITCLECAAKYSVPDEKVGDRSFRIRCKRCGEPILVRGVGTAATAPPLDETAVFHVMREGEAEGPLRVEQVIALIESEAIGWDTFVWREGMADWAEAESVAELRGPRPRSAAPTPDLITSARAATQVRPRSADPVGDPLTGTRNETSVLFSLSNLRDLSKPREATSTRRGAAPASDIEGSGLIDIRALATRLNAPRSESESTAIDPLMSLGSPQNHLLGVPVLIAAPREARTKTPVVAALVTVAITVAAAAAVIVAVVLTRGWEPTARTTPVTPPTDEVVAERLTYPDELPSIDTQATLTPATLSAETTEASIAEVAEVAAITAPRVSRPVISRHRPHPVTVEVAETEPRTRVTPPAVSEGDPIADILDGPPRTETPRSATSGRATPTSRDVQTSMRQIESRVAACSAGAATMIPVEIVFAGDTGHVRSAQVSGATLPAPVRSCVAQAARGAQVVPFDRETFSVRYPFRV